jgi:hypothetical protein
MLQMFSKKRLMNNLKRLFVDRFLFLSPIIEKLFSKCQPDFRLSGILLFWFSGFREYLFSSFHEKNNS